jgi:hypothetical protein
LSKLPVSISQCHHDSIPGLRKELNNSREERTPVLWNDVRDWVTVEGPVYRISLERLDAISIEEEEARRYRGHPGWRQIQFS